MDPILVAVDIEKTGHLLTRHPVVSFGLVVGELDGKILERLKVNFKVKWPQENETENKGDLHDFEERCWTEFWLPNLEKFQPNCTSNPDPISQAEGWSKIANFINELETKYKNRKIVFLSDNPSFDVANIDYYLEFYANRAPMRYTTGLKYRSIQDPTEQLRIHPRKEEIIEEAKQRCQHDHDPVKDAENIYWQYVVLKKYS